MTISPELLNSIIGISSSGIFLHIGYIILMVILLIEKRKSQLIIDLILEKNLTLIKQLTAMREELKILNLELMQLTRDNYCMQCEVQMLTMQINKLRDDIAITPCP